MPAANATEGETTPLAAKRRHTKKIVLLCID
jgi:hypothetical protein